MQDPTLRLYAIVRDDLEMPPGKLAAQAGHAFLDAFEQCKEADPERAERYQANPPGTKIVLRARNTEHIEKLYYNALCEGLPCALILDEHHIMPPHFDGNPIITALGIGPALRHEIQHITGKLQLV